MAQHDYNLANQSGADFRADLNNALSAIVTVNSGATAPSTTFAHQLWVDTSSSVLKIRNSANDAWVTTGVSITADNTFTGNLTGNVTGNVTGDITGNADTATALETARTINGTSFDGTANISFDTDSVSEGSSNLYYTSARFDSAFSGKSTSDLTEGTNLYFTNARVESYLDAGTSTPTFASAIINTSITGSAVLDDDTFGTASATTVATSESIKAYVDSQVGSVDTLAEILANGNTTGGTDIAFGDNDKAVFGTGSDLQIYHDGTNSHVRDQGTGDILISASDKLIIRDTTDGAQVAVFDTDGAVSLNYGNSTKFATTSTGIDVTGTVKASTSLMVGSTDAPARDLEIKTTNPHIRLTDTDASGGYTEIFGGSGITTINADKGQAVVNSALKLSVDATDGLTIDSNHNVDIPNGNLDVTGTVTSDGLTVDGDATISDGNPTLSLVDTTATNQGAEFKHNAGTTTIQSSNTSTHGLIKFNSNNGTDTVTRMQIDRFGDVSFYDDTGTTQGLFWDASAENLFVGGTSTTNAQGWGRQISSINSGTNGAALTLKDSNGEYQLASYANNFYLSQGANTRFFINSSGSVGIGTTSPDAALEVNSDSGIHLTANTVGRTLIIKPSLTGSVHEFTSDNTAAGYAFSNSSSELMRVNSTGLGIGTSSPKSLLNVTGTGADGGILTLENDSGSLITDRKVGQIHFYSNDGSANGTGVKADIKAIAENSIGSEIGLAFGTSGTGSATAVEAMRISADGSVGIGTDSPSGELHVKSASTNANFYLQRSIYDPWRLEAGSTYLTFSQNSGELMRIDASGNLLVGTTDTSLYNNTTGEGFSVVNSELGIAKSNSSCAYFNRMTSDGDTVKLFNRGVQVGSISTTSSATTYNTSSDARLKDVTGEARGLEVITKLNPVAYNWKADGKADEGLIAQEVKELVPNAVTGSEDEHYQMDYSKLVTHLVKAVQELEQQTIELKKEIANLKGE